MPKKQLKAFQIVSFLSVLILINAQFTYLPPTPVPILAPATNNFDRDDHHGPSGFNNGPSGFNNGPSGIKLSCLQYGGVSCSQCAYRYYSLNGNCVPVSDQCNTWDNFSGVCTTCYTGYSLVGGGCTITTSYYPATIIPNCNAMGVNSLCSQCANRFYNLNGYCQPVSNLCNTWDLMGRCLTCYSGYSVIGADCVLGGSSYITNYPNTPNCAQVGINGVCILCYNGYYVVNGICQRVNNLCNTWNPYSGYCTSCVSRYQLVGNNCVLGITGGPGNYQVMNCGRVSPTGTCQQCNNRYYLFNGFCNSVSPLCNAWNQSTGACTTCFSGYSISGYGCAQSNDHDHDHHR